MDKLEAIINTPNRVETEIKHTGSKLKLAAMSPFLNSFIAIGEVFNDSRFEDGSTIYTSSIEYINFLTGELKTRNTLYELIL